MHNWWSNHLVLKRNFFLSVIWVLPVLGVTCIFWYFNVDEKFAFHLSVICEVPPSQNSLIYYSHPDLKPNHWLGPPGLPPLAECSPGLCLCLPVGSMKFNEQRKLPEEWKIPLSHGWSYQQKPDGASPWIHYLCEIAFSPRKPMGLPPPSWHIQRNDQYQDENRPRSLLFYSILSFYHLCSSLRF